MALILSTQSVFIRNNLESVYDLDISYQSRRIVELVSYSILGHFVCMFGIVSNTINIIVFVKLGFTDTVNISLLALAMSDLCSVISLEFTNIIKDPLFVNSGIPWSFDDVPYLSSGATHAIFARITSWITAFVTFERCLCVLTPMKVKTIITGRVTKIVMVSVYFSMTLTHLHVFMSSYFGWRFYPVRNITLIGLIPRENMIDNAGISFTLAVMAQIVSFVAVILFTIILVVQMKRNSKWRQSVTSVNDARSKHQQKRDDKTVKMIVLIATIYIICFTPSIIVYVAFILDPRIGLFGKFKSGFFTAVAINFLFEGINSSINIFVYYAVSTKYRTKFNHLFRRTKDGHSGRVLK